MSDEGPALDTRRPFTRAAGILHGLSKKSLRGPRFRTLFRNVYVDATTPATPLQRVLGALTLFDDLAWASHASAARVYDVPIPTIAEEHVSVRSANARRHHPGIRTHVGSSWHVRHHQGVRVSDQRQMFVELAELIGLVDLVVVGDHLARKGLVSPDELRRFCAASTHRAAKAAQRAAAYVRDRVDSPMETRLRMLIVLAGLPEPEVNHTIRTDDGEPLRRYDLSYPGIRLIIEYDGRRHIEREESWESDLSRREAIDDEGWRILVVVASGIYQAPEQTVARIWKALRAGGHPDLPTRPTDGWRAHFPGHGQVT
jgi:very-short-patch-repair endonuclease